MQGDQKFPKITVEEPLEDLESENIETWQKLQQETTMQQIRRWFAIFVKEALNLWKMYEIGCTWIFQW